MTEAVSVNVDNNILVNYLYSTILAAATDGDAEFEYDKGCREYFELPEIYVVAGGKAIDEFENLCERRRLLYQDIEDFILETDNDIFEYELGWGDSHSNSNDQTHLRKGVKMNMHKYESTAEQLSVIRRCFQQMGECKRVVLDSELDEAFDQFNDSELSTEINRRLDIDHDAEILVDAAYIEKHHGVQILASTDPDITEDAHQRIVLQVIRDILYPEINLDIIDPRDTTVQTLLS
ncbi:hypothetical protein DJ69_01290 [Halorubrum persicum]|uniref:DUF4935 domain-containing protein n=1 Tax=Halorubrum persicum TaxID=1383844 RepID=A0A2G1WN74_9EURY|nr:hypothetical protein [Halorubrum persicum]PHQ40441.1 hypothetical protein DJ69_01290 [Halorubrum persicum]